MTRPLKTAADAPELVGTAGVAVVYVVNGFCSQIEPFLADTGIPGPHPNLTAGPGRIVCGHRW